MLLIARGMDWEDPLARAALERILSAGLKAFSNSFKDFSAYASALSKASKGNAQQGLADANREASSLARTADAAQNEAAKAFPGLNHAQFHDKVSSQYISLLVNKWRDLGPNGRLACAEVAAIVLGKSHANLLGGWIRADRKPAIVLTNLTGAFSRWPDEERFRSAAVKVFQQVPSAKDMLKRSSFFNWQELSNLAAAAVKFKEPDSDSIEKVCRDAVIRIAQAVLQRLNELKQMLPQHLSLLAIAMSKVEARHDPDAQCRATIIALAREIRRIVAQATGLRNFDPQSLSNAASALVKVKAQDDQRKETEAIEAGCRDALVEIAAEVKRRADKAGLTAFDPQHLSTAASALVKVTYRDAMGLETLEPGCRHALIAIGVEIGQRADADPGLQTFDLMSLSVAGNALVKVASEAAQGSGVPGAYAQAGDVLEPSCRDAVLHIEHAVVRRRQELSQTNPDVLAKLANTFSSRTVLSECHEGMRALAEVLGIGMHALDGYELAALAIVAHALSRHAAAAQNESDPDLQHLMQQRLHEIAAHLAGQPEVMGQAGARHIGMLVKAMNKAGLYDDVALLYPLVMQRLKALGEQTGLREDDFETLGGVCAALRPAVRTQDPSLRLHRRNTLEVLVGLLPHVQRKTGILLQHAGLATAAFEPPREPALRGEAWQARRPGFSLAHVLKTYAIVCSKWKTDMVAGTRAARETEREGMRAWLMQTAQQAEPLLAQEGGGAWAMQALIETDTVVGAMHKYLRTHSAKIKAEQAALGQHPAPVNLVTVANGWNHPPEPPQVDAAQLASIPLLDSFGREIQRDHTDRRAQPHYTVLARLTQGAPITAEVELPGAPKVHMLERFVRRGNVPYCINQFGGSRTVIREVRWEEMDADVKPSSRKPKVLGVRAVDLLPESPFMNVLKKLFPNKESFWYFQRLLMPSPPEGIDGLQPVDHVLEGKFTMMLMPDRDTPAIDHPFKLTDTEGNRIALRPYDGCGFIKESVMQAMPAYRKAKTGTRDTQEQAPASSSDAPARRWHKAPLGMDRPSNMALTALAHYPAKEAVAREIAQQLKTQLEAVPEQERPRGEALFRCVATGQIQGRTAILVASADDKVHLPSAKSTGMDGGDVVIGKSPYDKANLLSVEDARIGTPVNNDATGLALDRLGALQYSYVGVEDEARLKASAISDAPGDAPDRSDEDKPWMGMKGVDIVVPDDMWPAEYKDFDRVGPAKDVKVHSDWTETKTKKQATQDTEVKSRGAYVCTEVFAPGSLAALPLKMIKRLDADCDGDPVQLFPKLPELAKHVREHEAREGEALAQSFKPPKSHTPAIDPHTGEYDASRTEQLLSTYRGVIQNFTGLQATVLAQGPATQQWIAERALLRTYEGMAPQLKSDLYRLLEADVPDVRAVRQALAQAERVSEPLAANEPQHMPKEKAVYEPARALATQLTQLLQQWVTELETGRKSATALRLPDTQVLRLLRPDVTTALKAADTTKKGLQALLAAYPTRALSARLGYQPNHPVVSLTNVLRIGIKVGTDSFKSDTATAEFDACGKSLKAVVQKAPQLNGLPYSKGAGRRMAAGTMSEQKMVASLGGNNNLSAAVVRHCAPIVADLGLWPAPAGPAPVTQAMREAAEKWAGNLRGKAEAATPHITPVMEEIERKTEGKLALRNKTLKSPQALSTAILSKARRLNVDLEIAAAQIHRALRYTVVYEEAKFANRVQAALAELKGRGMRPLLITNHFTRGRTTRGIIAAFSQGEGPHARVFEVQFHTPASVQAKIDLHDVYKKSESEGLKARPDVDRQEQYIQQMRDACDQVPKPEGVDAIQSYDSSPASRRLDAVAAAGGARGRQPPVGASGEKASTTLTKRLYKLAQSSSKQITTVVKEIIDQASHNRILSNPATLREDLKEEKVFESIRRKIERKVQQAGGNFKRDPAAVLAAACKVMDAVRYDVELEPKGFAQDCKELLHRLKTHPDLELLRVKNAFAKRLSEDNPYKGINAAFNLGGQAFEVQFHTPESRKAKVGEEGEEGTHKLYKIEQVNRMRGKGPNEERQREIRERWAKVGRPAQWDTIESTEDIEALDRYAQQLQRRLSGSDAIGGERRQTVVQPLGAGKIALKPRESAPQHAGPSAGPAQRSPLTRLNELANSCADDFRRFVEDSAALPTDFASRRQEIDRLRDETIAQMPTPQGPQDDVYYSLLELEHSDTGITETALEQYFVRGESSGAGNECMFDSLYQAVAIRPEGPQLLQGLIGSSQSPGKEFSSRMQDRFERAGLLRRQPNGRFDQMDFEPGSLHMKLMADLLNMEIVFLSQAGDRFQLLPAAKGLYPAYFLRTGTGVGSDGHFVPLFRRT